MSDKLGRNELCRCGSGKKYKKCCLEAEVPSAVSAAVEDLKWRQLRHIEGTIVDDRLIPYVTRELPGDVLKSAYEDFLPKKLPKAVDKDLLFERLFIPWCLFNWIPADDFEVKHFNGQETIAENYLKFHRNKLSAKEGLFIDQMIHSHYSFYCILEIEIDQSLTVKDILLETTHILKERQGTHQLERGDVVYGRIVTLEGISIFSGMAPFRVGPEFLYKLIDLRNTFIKENNGAALSAELLRRDYDLILLDCFFEILIDSFNKPFPTLMNTDEELIVFTKSRFGLTIDPEEALGCLLPLALGADLSDLLEEAKRDKSGKVKKVEFSWMKEGNKKNESWSNTILGNILIEKGKLTLETNSQERAQLGRELLGKYLGDNISFQTSSTKTQEQMRRSLKRSKNNEDDEEKFDKIEESPEVKAVIKAMAESHWKNWFNEPIPVLGNKTPRQAAKTKEGRDKLEALLMEYERRYDDENPYKADINNLRKKLRLDSPATCVGRRSGERLAGKL